MEIIESGLTFRFQNDSTLKFDDTLFYRKHFNSFPNSKGVDILSNSADYLIMMEVKNCSGQESENRWRIAPNNRNNNIGTNRDSLDIEVAQKVAMTISCLVGAATFRDRQSDAQPLISFSDALHGEDFANWTKKLLVILFLEGNFGCHTRSKKTIMYDLEKKLRAKLKWLNCKVSVVDSSTYNHRIFSLV